MPPQMEYDDGVNDVDVVVEADVVDELTPAMGVESSE